MRDRIERIELDLPAKRNGGFVITLLLFERQTKIVVRVLVGRIYFELLPKGVNASVEFSNTQIGQPKLGPGLRMLGLNLGCALKKRNRSVRVARVQRGSPRFEQLVCGRGRGNRRDAGRWILDDQDLTFVGFDGVCEC